MELTGFDQNVFLRDYWQKKPLLIRNPWNAWVDPIEPEELAGLSCEETIESRLVLGSPGGPKVEHGPIAAERFDTLGNRDWTLLVQAVDHHNPDVAALLDAFRFIPNWRIDDVMVSFAAKGGGVGAHFDQYDVFLIQGRGERRWQIGGMCDEASELLPNGDLRLLAEFSPTDEWVLEEGDMLYVPPGIAHNGIAVSDQCMTYSVGFRAPSRDDLIAGWMDDLTAEANEGDRYADPDLSVQQNPGEISHTAIDRLHAMITEVIADRSAFAKWFGEYSSTSKYPEIDWQPEHQVSAAKVSIDLAEGGKLLRNPASRFAYIEGDRGAVILCAQGETFGCEGSIAKFARELCAKTRVPVTGELAASEAGSELIARLINLGSLAIEE